MPCLCDFFEHQFNGVSETILMLISEGVYFLSVHCQFKANAEQAALLRTEWYMMIANLDLKDAARSKICIE